MRASAAGSASRVLVFTVFVSFRCEFVTRALERAQADEVRRSGAPPHSRKT
jgi:hypothetical protein